MVSSSRRPKTKIVATVGPASSSPERLRALVETGVSIFRFNFAHGEYDEKRQWLQTIRSIGDDIGFAIAILGDLGGPKIRLGELPDGSLEFHADQQYTFAREPDPGNPNVLTTTYDGLIDDLEVDSRVILADGAVSLSVVEKGADHAVCGVRQPGVVRSGQGVNVPDIELRVPGITDKDREDLKWMIAQGVDLVGLSFVRSPNDIRELRGLIAQANPESRAHIVAKIEKSEAVTRLDDIVTETDAVMVARGDLGVEIDIVRVPAIQKRIIRTCNERGVPVITATQMLDSMERNRMPTRAEASDVANAVLDGSDAIMLSGETAIGQYPLEAVATMAGIAMEVEPFVVAKKELPSDSATRNTATRTTRAVALSATRAAQELNADQIVVLTRSGKTAFAVSELRSQMPILALTDNVETARWMSLAWGVRAVVTGAVEGTPQRLIEFLDHWAQEDRVLKPGQLVVLVGASDWSRRGKDLLLVHTVT
jgi:pyruvate kinase